MTMTPGLRKLALAVHVTFSVGWIGAVAAFLALAVAGLTSRDAQMVHAAYLAMEVTTWFVIVPLAIVSLLSGVVSSVGTSWGLFRHYWVLAKLLMTIFAIIALLIHTQPIDLLAAAETTAFSADLQSQQLHMLIASGAALVVLIALTVLSLYKPQGMTRYGWRKQRERPAPSQP